MPRLKVGQTVEIEVEAVPGLKFAGRVDRIAPQAITKSGIKGFSTRILVKNENLPVRPGMTANITIPLHSASDVLAVPLVTESAAKNFAVTAALLNSNQSPPKIVAFGRGAARLAELPQPLEEDTLGALSRIAELLILKG